VSCLCLKYAGTAGPNSAAQRAECRAVFGGRGTIQNDIARPNRARSTISGFFFGVARAAAALAGLGLLAVAGSRSLRTSLAFSYCAKLPAICRIITRDGSDASVQIIVRRGNDAHSALNQHENAKLLRDPGTPGCSPPRHGRRSIESGEVNGAVSIT
jgi:hypothetical protein